MDPHEFKVILQSGQPGTGSHSCLGFGFIPVPRPARIFVVGDSGTAAAWRDELVDALEQGFASMAGSGAQPCAGPGGFSCLAAEEPATRNLLIAVAGNGPVPSNALETLVEDWLQRGFEAFGVLRAGVNPDEVLPTALRSGHAALWRDSIREAAGEIIDSVGLGSEERRIFISYAHSDGARVAERLAQLLTTLRFEVFLDRFKLAVGDDFIERIDDELVDKAMVVVVETPTAVLSDWIRYEVTTAVTRRLGLTAVNLTSSPRFHEIDDLCRCCDDDDNAIGSFLLEQHRMQLSAKREALLDSVRLSLQRAGVPKSDIVWDPHGFQVTGPGQGYAITVRPRPADLQRFRLADGRANGLVPMVIHPRPARADRRRDLEWLSEKTGVVDVDEGLVDSAADLVMGTPS